jgi:hypothetical protein
VNPPKLTILTAGTDAACDPETGTCTIPQTPIPSPGAAPATGAIQVVSSIPTRGVNRGMTLVMGED